MLFTYKYNNDKDCPRIFVDMRTITNESDWQELRDVIGAFKLSLDCNCHVELSPLQEYCSNLYRLYKSKPILQVDIQLETWSARPTDFNDLSKI